MTDKQLYNLCKKYGRRAVLWRRKFLGLLPEVHKRRLYEKKKFSSVFEFAAKLGGVSHEQVRQVLGLEKRLEEKAPKLHAMLVEGEVSANKLIRVASIATPENEEVLAGYVQQLSKSALETFVRDEKRGGEICLGDIQPHGAELDIPGKSMRPTYSVAAPTWLTEEIAPHFQSQDAFYKAKNEHKLLPGQQGGVSNSSLAKIKPKLELSPEVHKKLLALQQKGIDINALLTEFLEKREGEIVREKEKIAAEIQNTPAKSRYIPVETKNLLTKEHGTRCAAPYCNRESQHIHHTSRFSLSRRHDPRFLAPLCADHHRIAHAIDQKFLGKIWGSAQSSDDSSESLLHST